MKLPLLASMFLLPLIVSLASCREKGPMEKAGESLDNAADNVKQAVNPSGPVERTGEKIDKALGN